MRTLLTSCTLVLALCGAALLTSCGGDAPADQHTTDEATYACPMHPEVTGKEGDKCSKCGMALEHHDPSAMSTATYEMKFAMEPATAAKGKAVMLSFTPRMAGSDAPVPLDVVHEKKIHLIIVSSDLSRFDHQHPDYRADGSYTYSHSFPEGGDYLLYADYKPTGGGHGIEKIPVTVDGPALPVKAITAEQRTGKVDGYEVAIDPKATFTTGSLQHFTARVTKGGKPVDINSVENFLGAKAHVVVIGAANKDYLHVHPEVEDGVFDLHASFETPGFYKGWFQFQTEGKVHTAEFVLDVKQGEEGDGHTGHDHGSGEEEKGEHAH